MMNKNAPSNACTNAKCLARVLLLAMLSLSGVLYGNSVPVVDITSVSQRTDGSYIVDVFYDVIDADGDALNVSLQVSADNGASWDNCQQVWGAVGEGIVSGTGKHIEWNAGVEIPDLVVNLKFKVLADDGYTQPPTPPNFIYVPGGTFTMGRTTGSGDSDELPVHSVTLSPFYIGKYEVTQAEYAATMGTNPAHGFGVGDNYPVYYVSWYATLKYCNLRSIAEGLTPAYTINGYTHPALWGGMPTSSNPNWDAVICNWGANGYRLPTEAEWEYAARGAANNPDFLYSGSNDINAVAWYYGTNTNEGYPSGTKPVGLKTPNGIGTYDMSGNILEWCWDWYSGIYYGSSPSNNPTGPSSGSVRQVRGGYWSVVAYSCRVARRLNIPPYSSGPFGFRVCRAIN